MEVRLRAFEVSESPREGGEIVQEFRDIRVIGGQDAFADGERLFEHAARLLEATLRDVENAEVVEGLRDFGVVWLLRVPQVLQCAKIEGLTLFVSSLMPTKLDLRLIVAPHLQIEVAQVEQS